MELNLEPIVSTLSRGQQFKNYNDLCFALQLKPTNGKSKRLQMEEISRFIRLEKQGHKLIVQEIYPVPKPKKEDQRNKYKEDIKYLISQSFRQIAKEHGYKNIVVFCSFPSLAYNLSMINDSFQSYQNQYFFEDIGLSEDQYRSFYYPAKQMLKGYIRTALKSLQKDNQLHCTQCLLLSVPHQPQRLLTEAEIIWYNHVYNESIAYFNQFTTNFFGQEPSSNRTALYRDFRDIILHKKVPNFYTLLTTAIESRFGSYARIWETYKMETTPMLLSTASEQIYSLAEIERVSIDLNQKLCQEMQKSQFLLAQDKLTPVQRDFLIADTISIDRDEYSQHIQSLTSGTNYYKITLAECDSTSIF